MFGEIIKSPHVAVFVEKLLRVIPGKLPTVWPPTGASSSRTSSSARTANRDPTAARLRAGVESGRVRFGTSQAARTANVWPKTFGASVKWQGRFFASVALMLGGIGLYGVLTYSVLRRTKEIGIRMALGARQSKVMRSITSEIASLVVLSVAAAVMGGLMMARFVTAVSFEVKPSDFWSFALPLGCLFLDGCTGGVGSAIAGHSRRFLDRTSI